MYKVTNLTEQTEFFCDAIETIIYRNGNYVPAERNVADGFNAMVIMTEEDGSEYYEITPFVYEGQILSGTEDTGSFEWIDDEPEPEEELEDEIENAN